jgi:phosphate starvation-inducible PhoH-like protein
LSARQSSDGGEPVRLQFDDNTLLPLLFGEHDQHLARIEQRLGVSLSTRGNRLAIDGPSSSVDAAGAALNALYERLKQGLAVGTAEVDAAMRFAVDAVENGGEPAAVAMGAANVTIGTRKRVISPRTPIQAQYIKALGEYGMVFGLGPAGTGKTYLAVAVAVAKLLGGEVDRIILSRPAVEAGERLGFLPGDLREKVDPYLRPLYDALYDMLPGDQVAKRIANGEIEIAPLAFMRGRTLANSFIILDEAQNTTLMQMKMLLTRLGENSRMAVTGDLSQVDLPSGSASGLADAVEILRGIEDVRFIYFTDADVVRHDLVTRVVRAYDARDRARAVKKRRDDSDKP